MISFWTKLCVTSLIVFGTCDLSSGVVAGMQMTESVTSVTCFGVDLPPPPRSACWNWSVLWLRNVYECVQHCDRDATCRSVFFRKVNRGVDCVLSPDLYDCDRNLTAAGDYRYAILTVRAI